MSKAIEMQNLDAEKPLSQIVVRQNYYFIFIEMLFWFELCFKNRKRSLIRC